MRINLKEIATIAAIILSTIVIIYIFMFTLYTLISNNVEINPSNSIVQVNGVCSGVVIEHKEVKYVITAAHCIASKKVDIIGMDNNLRKGKIKFQGTIDYKDIAIVEGNFDRYPALKISRRLPKVWEDVNIYSLPHAEYPVYTKEVKFLGEKVLNLKTGSFYYFNDTIVPGMSGGIFVNSSKEIIAIIVRGTGTSPISWGVRLDIIHKIMKEIK